MSPSSQATQSGLATAIAPYVDNAFGPVNSGTINAVLPRLVEATHALTTKYGRASAAIAVQDYTATRQAAGILNHFTVPHAPLPTEDFVENQVRWAVHGLWGPPATADTPEALEAARTNLQGAVDRMILDVGRETTIAAVKQDRKARGYARETEPGACSFCLLLATRGAVYKEDSFEIANSRFEGLGTEKTHDHCHCIMVPVFGPYEPTAEIRRAQALYKESTKGVRGANNMRNAFRRAVELDRNPAPLVETDT